MLFRSQLGRSLLEGVDRGVVAEDIVAELGLIHCLAHGRRGVRDGVAAEVYDAAAPIGSHNVEYRSAGFAGGFGGPGRR